MCAVPPGKLASVRSGTKQCSLREQLEISSEHQLDTMQQHYQQRGKFKHELRSFAITMTASTLHSEKLAEFPIATIAVSSAECTSTGASNAIWISAMFACTGFNRHHDRGCLEFSTA